MDKRVDTVIVATILRSVGETGVQTHFRSLLTYLEKESILFDLVTPFSEPAWRVVPLFALRWLINPINGTASVWWYRKWHEYFLRCALKKKLGNGKPCVIYAQCPLSARAALRARVSPLQRIVMVVHFNVSQADEWAEKKMIKLNGRLYKSIQKIESDILRRVNGLVFVSGFMRDKILERNPGLEKKDYLVIPNFIDDPGDVPKKGKRSDLLCVGTLEPRKNQTYLLRIIAAARDQGRPLYLTVIGNGPDRKRLERLSGELGIGQLVHFAGHVSDASKLMGEYKAFIHGARMENFPMALIEALAHGLPLFAPAVGGVSEVFEDGVEGRYIPLDDAPRAARKIMEWFENHRQMDIAGKLGRERFLRKFELSVVAKRLVEFLLVKEVAGVEK